MTTPLPPPPPSPEEHPITHLTATTTVTCPHCGANHPVTATATVDTSGLEAEIAGLRARLAGQGEGD